MKNLGLTNDKEVSKYSKHNLPALFRKPNLKAELQFCIEEG